MININQNTSNEIVLYLNDKITLDNPYFIFEFIDNYGEVNIRTLSNDSTAQSYNLFTLIEGSDITLKSSGEFNVYESVIDTDNLEGLNLIYNDLYKFIRDKSNEYVFNPDISSKEYVYQPIFTKPYNTTDGIFQTTDGNFQVVEGDFQVNE